MAGDMFEKAERDSILPIVADRVLGVATSSNSKAKPSGRYGVCYDAEFGDRVREARFVTADTVMPPPSGVRVNKRHENKGNKLRGVK